MPNSWIARESVMYYCSYACADEPTDTNVVHPCTEFHAAMIGTPRHGVPECAAGETKKCKRHEEEFRGIVFAGVANVRDEVDSP